VLRLIWLIRRGRGSSFSPEPPLGNWNRNKCN